jgi:crotonobetaine/carnitine-CoA ligase
VSGAPLVDVLESGLMRMVEGRDVPGLLRRQAERYPEKPFLVWEPFAGPAETWTYKRMHEESTALAGGLAARGARAGDRILIHLANSPEFVIAWFACARLGAIAVSTNTRSVPRDIAYFADHAGVMMAVTSPEFASVVADNAPGLQLLVVTSHDAGEPAEVPAGVKHVRFDDIVAEAATCPVRKVDPWADLGIQYTSGTTSRPKAVLWTHANAIWGAQVNVAHMRLRHEDITLVVLPLFHTNAQSYSMLSTLWTGGTVVLQPRFSASRFWDVSVRHRVTWCSLIPFCLRALREQETPPAHSYRFWAPAAELPYVDAEYELRTFGWWGMTETITQGIVGSPDQPAELLSIGRASPAYDISIRHPDGAEVGPGERGELFIRGVRGVSLFKEYYRNPEATAACFDADGWFETGDIIRVGLDGELFFGDRSKDMLKVGAENVSASEIESVIMATGWVAECAVVGQPHAMLDEVPVAFVIGLPTAPPELAPRILEACAADLADFKRPRQVHVVDELPRSTLEKVAKGALRARLPLIDG